MNGAVARILLRYVVGAAIAGSPEIGNQLAMDPDVVALVSAGIGLCVEGFYWLAKKRGWTL